MKRTIILLLGCAALMLPAAAGFQKHTFTSADGTKSFEGYLTDYDAKSGVVSVKKSNQYHPMQFKLALLSEKDVSYVKENANAIVAARAIRLDFDIFKEKVQTVRTDAERTTTTPVGYEIGVKNWTKKTISDVEIRYTIFHREAAADGLGAVAKTEGTIFISTLFDNTESANRTDSVDIVRYIKQKSGGG